MHAIAVAIHEGALPAKAADCLADCAGALVSFEGIVRPFEEGRGSSRWITKSTNRWRRDYCTSLTIKKFAATNWSVLPSSIAAAA